MTLDEIDKLLASWQERLARVDENLIALEQDPTCLLLEGRDGQPRPLEGVTHQRVTPALLAMRELFEQRALLNSVLHQAREQRAGLSRLWVSEKVVAEIEQLLKGRSIKLPPVQTPLAQRGLLSQAQVEVAVSPEELLGAMLKAFEQARDAVTETGVAWAKLQEDTESSDRELTRLGELANEVGAGGDAELAELRRLLDTLRLRIGRDPLGVSDSVRRELRPRLEAVRSRFEAALAARDGAKTGLEHARASLAELERAHLAAIELYGRVVAEVENPPSLVPPPNREALGGLAPWLETLSRKVHEGHYPQAVVGLSRFEEAVRGLLSQVQTSTRASEAPLRTREELLGRLSARRAQAKAALARSGGTDAELDQLGREAEEACRHKPFSLTQAETKVAAFEAKVRALVRH